MSMRWVIVGVGLLALLPRLAGAESGVDLAGAGASAAAPPRLDQYLAVAARQNPGLQAAFASWEAAMQAIAQVEALPEPRFTYSNYLREVETRVGPQRQSASLTQTFPWFGKLRLRGDMAAQEALAAWETLEARRLALYFEVQQVYYDYYFLKRSLDIAEENLRLLSSLEQVARQQYTGGGSMVPVTQAQVELGKLQQRFQSLQDMRPALAAKFNALLNRPSTELVPWPRQLPEQALQFDLEAALARLATNPEVKRLEALGRQQQYAQQLAHKSRFPDITLGINGIDTGGAVMSGVDGSGDDPIMATVSINLPIWFGKYKAAEEQARAKQRQMELSKQQVRNSLAADLQLAWYGFQDSERKIDLYADTLIPMAQQSLEVARQAFTAGNGRFLDLIEAQRLQLEFQLALAEARSVRGKQLARIEQLTAARAVPELQVQDIDQLPNP